LRARIASLLLVALTSIRTTGTCASLSIIVKENSSHASAVPIFCGVASIDASAVIIIVKITEPNTFNALGIVTIGELQKRYNTQRRRYATNASTFVAGAPSRTCFAA